MSYNGNKEEEAYHVALDAEADRRAVLSEISGCLNTLIKRRFGNPLEWLRIRYARNFWDLIRAEAMEGVKLIMEGDPSAPVPQGLIRVCAHELPNDLPAIEELADHKIQPHHYRGADVPVCHPLVRLFSLPPHIVGQEDDPPHQFD